MTAKLDGTNDWAYVCQHLPIVKDAARPMSVDVYNEVGRIYKSGTFDEVQAAMLYLHIRGQYYFELEEAGVNLRHLNHYEMAAAQVWWTRLNDRRAKTDSARFGRKGKLIAGKVPKKVVHDWLN